MPGEEPALAMPPESVGSAALNQSRSVCCKSGKSVKPDDALYVDNTTGMLPWYAKSGANDGIVIAAGIERKSSKEKQA